MDHVIRLVDGGTDADVNLQSLCHVCHTRKTAKENGARPRGCDVNGTPTDPEHPWSR